MKHILFVFLLFASVVAMSEDRRPGHPIDQDAYNVHEFRAEGTAVGDYIDFTINSRATLLHNAWRQVQSVVDEMANRKDIPDGASFLVTVQWRGAEFSRVVVAHRDRGTVLRVYVGPLWIIGPRRHFHPYRHPHRHYSPPNRQPHHRPHRNPHGNHGQHRGNK